MISNFNTYYGKMSITKEEFCRFRWLFYTIYKKTGLHAKKLDKIKGLLLLQQPPCHYFTSIIDSSHISGAL